MRVYFEIGVIRPSSLIAGGKPAVRNRSEALCATIRRSQSAIGLGSVLFMTQPMNTSLLTATARASAAAMTLRLTSSIRAWSRVCMPMD